jgi:ATP-binding cassette subfamily F protein uup
MDLLRLEKAHLHYGTQVLLDGVDLQITRGQRLGLLGRNGEGKSTLLRVLAGELAMDSGERWLRPGTRIARLEQELPEASDLTLYDYVASGLAETGELLKRYAHLAADPNADLKELERVQHALEAADGWQLEQRVQTTLTQLGLEGDSRLAELSGGWRRRAALARALVGDPDILLLDEPTNHLDIPAIAWLQEQLVGLRCALVLITHDRRFLQAVADHIAELDRGSLTVWEGSYSGFLRHREQQLAAEERANALFDKKLSEEERWIRQGIKARRTRNEGRVRALKAMRDERQSRRARTGKASLALDNAQRSGKLVAELEDVSIHRGERTVIDHCLIAPAARRPRRHCRRQWRGQEYADQADYR